jgi:hypothetical protein
VFLDRVLSLQHNGGCFLSKRTWLNARTNRNGEKVTCASDISYEVSGLSTNHQSMVPILDAHAANPPDAKSLYSGAHRTVRAMTYKYMELAESVGITATWGDVKVPGKAWTPDTKLELPQVPTAITAMVVQPIVPTANQTGIKATKPVLTPATVPIKEIIESGLSFKVMFTITQIRNGTQAIDLPTPILKSYSFKTAQDFLDKKFYTGHMLKSQHPGAKASKMSVQLVQGKKRSNSHEFAGWSIQMKTGYTINYIISSND